MKPRLIILSDLWGIQKSDWIDSYILKLKSKYEIHYYDCCDLAKVDKTENTAHNLHTQFVNGGIEVAVNRLLELERENIDVLAFSIGGTIAWKAEFLGLKINRFYSISSTRLRYETQMPNCNVHLYFGEKDENIPNSDWYSMISVDSTILKNRIHTLYSEKDCIDRICQDIMCNFD
jgi:hypothetical protein